MNLWTLITTCRDAYVAEYARALADLRPKLADLAPELLVTPSGADEVPEPYRVFRADLIWRDAQTGEPRVGSIGFQWNPLAEPCVTTYPDGDRRVTVKQFKWDDCVLRVAPALADDAPLREWLGHWLDRENRNPPAADGLRAAVHSMTPPQPTIDRSASVVAVDFGSAPAEAVTSLIAAFFAAGARRIDVGE